MKQYEKWMPLYIADYLADTSRLTLEQHGAYLLLIMDYWRNGPPPDDQAILSRIVGATEKQWSAIAPVLQRLFRVESGLWRHKRIDEELARAKRISNIRSEIATNRHANDDAKNMQLHTPLPLPLHKTLEPSPSQKARGTPAGALSAALRALGVIITPSNPVLVGWMEAGASEGIIREAVEMARERKPAPQRIPAAYLDPIVRELLAPPTSGGNGSSHHADPVDGQCQQFADGERCKSGVTFWNRSATKGNCAKHGPF